VAGVLIVEAQRKEIMMSFREQLTKTLAGVGSPPRGGVD